MTQIHDGVLNAINKRPFAKVVAVCVVVTAVESMEVTIMR